VSSGRSYAFGEVRAVLEFEMKVRGIPFARQGIEVQGFVTSVELELELSIWFLTVKIRTCLRKRWSNCAELRAQCFKQVENAQGLLHFELW
jgi:hypothetical protein